MGDRRIVIGARVDRGLWFKFREFAHSHDIAVERALEVLIRDALSRAGFETDVSEKETSSAVARRLDPARYVKA